MMLKNLILLVLLLPSLAYGHGAPVIFSGSTVGWIPAALKSAGMCKLDANGVMTSGQADLTSNVTGVLPLANGGTNKNATAVNGGLVYSDADSFEVTAAGTSGRAVVSGGAGAPTFYAPTLGSILFAGTSGVLAEDNAALFWDLTNDRLGIGTASPSGTLDVTNVSDTIRGNIVLWGQGRGANSEWLIYDSPIGDVSMYNPNQAVYGWSCRATGGCSVGTYALGSGNQMLGVKNNAGETAKHTLVVEAIPAQTGDAFRLFANGLGSTLAKIEINGDATFGTVTAALTGNASTASALAANPSDCASDTYATTIAASGNLTCASITNASTTASASAGNSTIVMRDGSGNFAAGTITAALTGNASTATALAANPADCSAGTKATAIAANGDLTCSAASLTADVSGTLPVANGGTGATTLTDGGVLIGNGTGVVTQLAVAAAGTVLGGVASSDPAFTATPTLGVAGTTKGTLAFAGNTSGTVTLQPAAAAGTYTLTLPTDDGTSNQFLQTNGSGVLTWASGGGGMSSTEWAAYTPTLSAAFGTTSNVNFLWRRVGDTIEVRGTFTIGTTAASLGTITLPNSYTLDATKIGKATTDTDPSPRLGLAQTTTANQFASVVACTTTSTSVVYISRSTNTGSALVPGNIDIVFSPSVMLDVQFSFPASGLTNTN